jgi:hypothetical protein
LRKPGPTRQNYRRAETDNEAAFWFGVLEVLTPRASPQAEQLTPVVAWR